MAAKKSYRYLFPQAIAIFLISTLVSVIIFAISHKDYDTTVYRDCPLSWTLLPHAFHRWHILAYRCFEGRSDVFDLLDTPNLPTR